MGARGLLKNVFSQWWLLSLLSRGKTYFDYEELHITTVLLCIPLYKSKPSQADRYPRTNRGGLSTQKGKEESTVIFFKLLPVREMITHFISHSCANYAEEGDLNSNEGV